MLGVVIVPRVVVISLLAPTLFDVAERSGFGNPGSPVKDGGNLNVPFGLGSAMTVDSVAESTVDEG
jgi:hypothetical protein